MGNIKLSYFKGVSRFKFIDGIFSKVQDKLEGADFEFYTVSLEEINQVKTDVGDNQFLYSLVGLLSNVEVDITFEQFNKMVMFPSESFADYVRLLLQQYKNLFRTAKKISVLSEDTEAFVKDELGQDVNIQDLLNKAKEVENMKTDIKDE